MAINPTSPVSGSAQTGLTSPTFALTADVAPAANAKQYAVTALGGSQPGVIPHSVAAPFTQTVFRPQNPKVLSTVNPITGRLKDVPVNNYKVITRKGVLPLAGQAFKTAVFTTDLGIPAGSDIADPTSLRSAISAHIGLLMQVSAGLGDTTVNGVL